MKVKTDFTTTAEHAGRLVITYGHGIGFNSKEKITRKITLDNIIEPRSDIRARINRIEIGNARIVPTGCNVARYLEIGDIKGNCKGNIGETPECLTNQLEKIDLDGK